MIAFHIDIPKHDPFPLLKNGLPRIEKLILGRMGEKIVAQTTKEYIRGQRLKRQSGNLANSLKYRMVNDYTIEVGPGMIYGHIHEEGGVIRPKNAKNLAIPIGNRTLGPRNYPDLKFAMYGQKKFLVDKQGKPQFVLKREVTIPKRPWLYPSIKHYFDSGRAGQLAERTLAAELDKLSRRN